MEVPLLVMKDSCFLRNRNIKWTFNHQVALWTDVFFEGLVKSVSRYSRKILGKAKINFDENYT